MARNPALGLAVPSAQPASPSLAFLDLWGAVEAMGMPGIVAVGWDAVLGKRFSVGLLAPRSRSSEEQVRAGCQHWNGEAPPAYPDPGGVGGSR